MKKSMIRGLTVLVLGSMLITVAKAQQPRRVRELPPDWKTANLIEERIAAEALRFAVIPYPKDEVPKNIVERTLRERVAAELSRWEPVPEPRLLNFQSLEEKPLVFRGWSLYVKQVVPTPTGWRATVRARPMVASSFGTSAAVLNAFTEHYEYVNGTLHFIRGEGKPGVAYVY